MKYVYYEATLKGRGWRQNICCACECVYRYRVERSVKDTGGLEVIAAERAAQQLPTKLARVVRVRPCPTCGTVQPEMAAQGKILWQTLTALGGTAALAGLGVAAVYRSVPFVVALAGAAAVAAAAVWLQRRIALGDPAQQREANLQKAQSDVAAGRTVVVQPGDASDPLPQPRLWTSSHTLGVVLGAVVPLVFLAPAGVVAVRGLPDNPVRGAVVVGPGTTFKIPFPPPSFQSIDGLWAAKAGVELLNAAEVGGPPVLPSDSQPTGWTNQFKMFRSWAPAPVTDLWASATVPDDPALGGRTLRLRATLNVGYPVDKKKDAFEQKKATVSHEVTVVLAESADVQAFALAQAVALVFGGLGAVAGLGLLLWGTAEVRSQAPPGELVQVGD